MLVQRQHQGLILLNRTGQDMTGQDSRGQGRAGQGWPGIKKALTIP